LYTYVDNYDAWTFSTSRGRISMQGCSVEVRRRLHVRPGLSEATVYICTLEVANERIRAIIYIASRTTPTPPIRTPETRERAEK